ncbi:MAG: acylphosphatase [Lachnospiraceae bacterium]
MKIRKHMIVHGRVQGVGFRYRSSQIAQELGLHGAVRNLPNGDVELQVQGEEGLIDTFMEQLREDSYIRIDSIESETVACMCETGFQIRM